MKIERVTVRKFKKSRKKNLATIAGNRQRDQRKSGLSSFLFLGLTFNNHASNSVQSLQQARATPMIPRYQ